MQRTRATLLLMGTMLSGCVGGPFYPRSYGGYSPLFGSVPYYGDRYYGDRYWIGSRPWYDNRYDGRSARELAEDQARARQRLLRDQQERRENLLQSQRGRRENRQAEGTWRQGNVRYQQHQ